ncbi:MAG: hypothetical protein FJ148_22830 [Deltaproteobacteria bacterium]|nr:hypothetical protein [Deltaproteobacteria bacterium]
MLVGSHQTNCGGPPPGKNTLPISTPSARFSVIAQRAPATSRLMMLAPPSRPIWKPSYAAARDGATPTASRTSAVATARRDEQKARPLEKPRT